MAMIIAEAGIWHQGEAARAVDLIRTAAACRVDAIKFQIFVKDEPLFCPLSGDEKRREYWNASAMSYASWRTVRNFASREKIKFGASIFQNAAVDLLQSLKPDFVKVASRAATTFPYAEFDGPFYISTGFIDAVTRQSIAHRLMAANKELRFLHCVSEYPTPRHRARWPGNGDGLSDHSGEPLVAIEAFARGCDLIEVHFTTDYKEGAPDNMVSLMPHEILSICRARDVFAEMRQGR